jgi:hypothetical protein
MPALFFPNLDALRLVLASGIIPPAVTGAPARAGFDANGRLWLEPAAPPGRDALAGLARLGVQALGAGGGLPTEPVGCWAELLPLRRTSSFPNVPHPGLTLFELPDRGLVRFVRALRRQARAPVGVRLLPAPGRAWVTCTAVPPGLLLECEEADRAVTPFVEQVPGVWVAVGWEHPLPDRLVVPPERLLLLTPPRAVAVQAGPVPVAEVEEYPVGGTPHDHRFHPPASPVPVELVLKRASDSARDELWVFPGAGAAAFWEFCRSADERLTRGLEVVDAAAGGGRVLVVRPAASKHPAPPPSFPANGYRRDPRVPHLLLPAGRVLRPALRVKEVSRALGLSPDRVTWLDPHPTAGVVCRSVPAAAFRPVSELLDYAAPEPVRLAAEPVRSDRFAFARFCPPPTAHDRGDPTDGDDPTPPERSAEGPPDGDDRAGWLARSLGRLTGRLRPPPPDSGDRLPETRPPAPAPAKGRRGKAAQRPPARVEEKLASADALLHGQDRAAHRHELEARMLTDFPRLGPDRRAAGWGELAAAYTATGNPADAAVCWINAVWEADPLPVGWVEQWFHAECRGAKQPADATLDHWLGVPGRFGVARVVAAYTVWAAHRSPPPADLVAALPRVLGFLDAHLDDLPARAAWLARLAATRLCEGDALGLARWRDRILARLRDRGPGLDLDEPTFLRFHGTASPDRFQTARAWLARARKPILGWVVGKHRPAGRLQWVGLDAEADCTAAYAQLMLAWGLGCLGEGTRSRDWTARSRKVLARPAAPGVNPAVHALLFDAFHHRIRAVQEGRPAKPGLPPDLLARYEQLPWFGRYAVDRLREHSRILEPAGQAPAFRGLALRAVRGYDLLGERLQLLADRPDPGGGLEEARQLLAVCAEEPSSATVPRVVLTLLDLAPHLDGPTVQTVLGHVAPAVSWLETWLQAGRWDDADRAAALPRYLARLLTGAFGAAAHFNLWPAVRPVVDQLRRRTPGDPALRAALARAAGPLFRALRKLGYRADAEALLHTLDPGYGAAAPGAPFAASRLGLAVGWFAVGAEEAGTRILDEAQRRLFVTREGDERERTELAIAYADALGFAPPRIALGRLEQIFQLLDRVTVTGSTNQYYTLKPLQLIDGVVRSVVTEDFALGPAVRGWLDDDEFLIRRRIHRDMAAVLRDDGLG